MHGWNGDWPMGGMWMWWIIVVGIVLLVVWQVNQRSSGEQPPRESPEQILKRRYAGGEIDHDEYERRLSDLRA